MRARTGWGVGLAVLGVICIAVAAILAWVVVPSKKQLPADTDTVRQFDGTAKVLLNPQALASNDLKSAILNNVPVTAKREVKVTATDGSAAQVSDDRVLQASGQPIGQSNAAYAVDRTSLEATTDHPSDWQVAQHEGLTVSWPIGSQQQDYTGWVNETQTTTPIKYVRQEDHGGVSTYVYTASVPATPIKDKQVLSALPPAIPQGTLGSLAAALPLPAEVKAGLAQALPQLSNPVPLSYTYESTSTYWVEPTTGIVIDTEREDIRKAGIGGPGGKVLAAVPVYDVTTKFTSQSVADAASDANDATSTINTYGKTLPWILGIVGLLALIAGLVLALTGRGRGGTPAVATSYPGSRPSGTSGPPQGTVPPGTAPPQTPPTDAV